MKKHTTILGLTISTVIAITTLGCTKADSEASPKTLAAEAISSGKEQVMTSKVTVEDSVTTTDSSPVKKLPLVTVYKSATCGCCMAWIDHMKDNGFPVEWHDADNLNDYKAKAKLGPGLGSCHTAFVGDYAIEGHVPADDIKRLLKEKPDISGLTAPGMPMQSPGMAPKGTPPKGYDVVSFRDGEAVGVFTKY